MAALTANRSYIVPMTELFVYDSHADTLGLIYFYFVQAVSGIFIENREASGFWYNGRVIQLNTNLLTEAQTIAARTLSTVPRASVTLAARAVVAYYTDLTTAQVNALNLNVTTTRLSNNVTVTYSVTGMESSGIIVLQAVQEWWARDDGTLEPAWFFDVGADTGEWVGILFSSNDGELLKEIPYTTNAADTTYLSYPPKGKFDPFTVPQQLYVERDVSRPDASPNGWSTNGSTVGPNMKVLYAPTGSLSQALYIQGNLSYPYNISNPLQDSSIASAISMVFFYGNYFHDLLFRYGFDEGAGSFQDVNPDGSTGGNDGILALIQFGPPDGFQPTAKYYLFEPAPGVIRDSAVDWTIVYHELFHGVSNRLTGGRKDASCLSTFEARGMGEGWSDTFAWLMQMTPDDTRASVKLMAA
ncbi:Fungalysin/Thermolysin Extracellular metalloproteinase 5, partial [Gonapodya sp. JEL0774]